MSSPTTRFSNRVKNYVKYRPGYPPELFDFLQSEIGLTREWTIADIGSGTGISAAEFLKLGNRVFGIEPNAPMREASRAFLSDYQRFQPIDGSSSETGLTDDSVDLVFSAQAFHWFCNREAAAEMLRILRPDGYVALVWNERELDVDSFHKDLESFLTRFATDYEEIRHDQLEQETIENEFRTEFSKALFKNRQILDFEGLKGRVLSSSYMPDEASVQYEEMVENLESVFAVHEENDRITVLYQTILYYAHF